MWDQMSGMYMRQFVIPDADIANFGVYGEYRKSFNPKLRLVAGLRLDTTKSEADSSKANTNLYSAFRVAYTTKEEKVFPHVVIGA